MNENHKTNRRAGWTLGALAVVALLVGSVAAAGGPGAPFGEDDHPGADAPGRERSAEARGHGAADDDQQGDSDGADPNGSAAGESHNGTITVCHVPPGNPDAAHTIQIGAPAWQAHEAHGDFQGACPGDEGDGDDADENETDEPEGNETGEPEGNETGEPEGNETGEPEGNETGEPEGNETGEPEGNETVEQNATADVGVSANATSDGESNATFTFVVGSQGNATATNVTLDVSFSDADANATLSGDAADSCTLGNGTVSCDLGDLAPGDELTLVLELSGTVCGDVSADATVSADDDVDGSDDAAQASAAMRTCD